MSSAAALLELRGIAKRFGPVHALRGADFTLRRGEIHALLGENGAGKTTMMHVAYGLVRQDAGDILLDGRPVAIGSPRAARRLGIGMVHQHFTSIPAFTVAENVALETGWRIRPRELRDRVAAVADAAGLPLDPSVRAESLSVSLLQRLEIVKALAADTRILLLDEPTAVLTPQEADDLVCVVRRFAERGGAAVLITHKLREALAAADRVTVLRRGQVVLTGAAREETAERLASAMLGAEAAVPGGTATQMIPGTAAPLVTLRGVSVQREGGRAALTDVALAVGPGEIVGIAAVEGNGQHELLRCIAGLIAPAEGTLTVAQPVAHIAEDRTTEGLIPPLSLTGNFVLGTFGRLPFTRGMRIGWPEARRRTAAVIEEANVRALSPDVAAEVLSGGNQQKFVVARALATEPRVIVAENPTRGLDLHAAAAVHDAIRGAAARGAAVLVHSSDLDEVLELATRVVVVANGRLVTPPDGASRDAIGRLMLAAPE